MENKSHIRPFCYKLYGLSKKDPKIGNIKYKRSNSSTCGPIKTMWRMKDKSNQMKFNVTFTFMYTSQSKDWYFDNGCFRHMIGNSLLFVELKRSRTGQVTFGMVLEVMLLTNVTLTDLELQFTMMSDWLRDYRLI